MKPSDQERYCPSYVLENEQEGEVCVQLASLHEIGFGATKLCKLGSEQFLSGSICLYQQAQRHASLAGTHSQHQHCYLSHLFLENTK
jgi:hypothetical protein